MGDDGEHTTRFASSSLQGLKAMVSGAQPDKIDDIAAHWMHVYDKMSGDAEDGNVRELLDKTVADVMEYWHGDAAKAFAVRARKLSTALQHGSLYAKNTSNALKHAAGDLRKAKAAVAAVQDTASTGNEGGLIGTLKKGAQFATDGIDYVGDGGNRSDAQLDSDLNSGMSSSDGLAKHHGSLSRGREMSLLAAIEMEQLGASYVVQAKRMREPANVNPEGSELISPPDGIVPPPVAGVPVAAVPASPRHIGRQSQNISTTSGTSSPGSAMTSPRGVEAKGTAGGDAGNNAKAPAAVTGPQPGTALDGVRGGVPTPSGAPGTPGTPGTSSIGVVGGGTPGGPGSAAGGFGTVPGPPRAPGAPRGGGPPVGRGPGGGRTTPGTPGQAGRAPVGRGGSAVGRGPAGRSVPPGIPGQPGQTGRAPMGGTGTPGAGGRGPGAPGRAGGGARHTGGTVGGLPRLGTPGQGNQGGSGLHRSRGGALGNGMNPRPGGPMAIPPRGRSTQANEEQLSQSERPDYLVEDEGTWVTQCDVVPGVVGETAPVSSPENSATEPRREDAARDTPEGTSRG